MSGSQAESATAALLSPPPPYWPSTPRRIVSLVPSLTESLFELGLGASVVGVTDWCVHPAAGVAGLPKVGGTKDPDLDAIVKLAPDLVIANREENTERAVRKLGDSGLCVWVSYPRTVLQGARLLGQLSEALEAPAEGRSLAQSVAAAVDEAMRHRERASKRVFCPIWRDPWMSIGRDTYVHDLIELCGGANVFADASDRRYPLVSLDDVVAAQPDVVLLPDEPYAFAAADAEELAALEIPAAASGSIHLIDGTLLSWYGPRIARAIPLLRSLL